MPQERIPAEIRQGPVSLDQMVVRSEKAENTGKVIIRRKDGRTFALVPEKVVSSPLDVPSIKAKITTQEIVDIIREGREK